ncbi:MAG: sugar ABC transporter ATP-binding protein, partial [Mesorhizobium sp.]|nr:sugar ABC transporter ATP-binding protein [Mesorhizobium sp.]
VGFWGGAGEVHALLGENGAGKSTLVRILSGLTRPDVGVIRLFGAPVNFSSPAGARNAGIRTAYQEISLIPDLTVVENFALMEEPLHRIGLIHRRRRLAQVAADLERMGLTHIDPRAVVRDLDLPTRQRLEIARAMSRRPKLLLLDEPTASISAHDVEWLEGLISEARSGGMTTIFISHRMREVRSLCDTVSVLRNGRCAGTLPIAEADDDRIIEMTIGRQLSAVFPPKTRVPSANAEPLLAVSGLAADPGLVDVSFSLKPGQILGVGALQGMGQREMFMALFGAQPLRVGEIRLDGRSVRFREPADAVRAGIGLVPEDRKSEGLFLHLDGRENLSLPSIGRLRRIGLVGGRVEAAQVRRGLARVAAPDRAFHQKARQFSGGNQQKLVLARWLVAESRILLLYDPTRGVDIPTKAEIYRLITDFAASGGTVLFYSSDIVELVNLCSEVMVLYRGRIADRLRDGDVTEMAVIRAALGAGETAA